MPNVEKRTISLPAEQAAYLDEMVKSGNYASASEVVREGLRALRQRDAAVETWLRKEVVPVYDAMKSDPSRGVDADSILAEVRGHDAASRKGGG